MNATINVLVEKLQTLMGDLNYRFDFNPTLDPPEQLIEIGEHNLRELEKFEAMGEERKERIWNLMAIILATGFQKLAIEKYGATDTGKIRKVLEDLFQQPDNQAFFGRLRHTEEQCLLGSGLTEEQCHAAMKYIFDKLPEALMEYLEDLYSPLRFLPRSEAQSITMTLADMMKEVAP